MCVSWVWAVDNSCQAGPLLFLDPQLPVPAGPEGRHRRLRRRHPTRTAKRWLSLLRRWGKKSETGSTRQAGRKPDAELFPDHPSRTISLCHRDVGTNRGGRRCDREVGSPGSASTGKLSRGSGGWQCTAWRAFVIGLRGPVGGGGYTLELDADPRRAALPLHCGPGPSVEWVRYLVTEKFRNQEDLPAEEALSPARPRLPEEDALGRRPSHPAAAAPKGPHSSDALAGPVGRRAIGR
jgi:hypothetical protein